MAPKDTAAPRGTVGKTQTFTLTLPSGQRTTYASKLEADAQRIRSGGGTISKNG